MCILYSIFTAYLHIAITYHYISYLLFFMLSAYYCLFIYWFYVLQLHDVCYFIFNLSVQSWGFLGARQTPEAHPLLSFNSYSDFLYYFQIARIMIILEVEVTFMVDLFIGQVVLVL